VLADIASCGISDVVVVTSPESQAAVSAFVDRHVQDLNATIVVQAEPNGLAAAYALALPQIGDSSSLLYLGDCLLTGGASHLVRQHEESGADATLMVKEVADPSRYGIVEVNDEGLIISLAEKPQVPRSNLAIVGVYAFEPSIGRAVASIAPSARGEYEITDAIQYLVDNGGTARAASMRGWWVDTGTVGDVISANARLMSELTDQRAGDVSGSEMMGAVSIAASAVVRDSQIHGPTIIDEGAELGGSHVGPFSHIGRNTVLEDAQVTNSIIMEEVELRSVRVRDSIIGPRSTVIGSAGQGWIEVVVGSDTVLKSGSSQEG
jgi:glucose-1-phosphate thymidylyltransferase